MFVLQFTIYTFGFSSANHVCELIAILPKWLYFLDQLSRYVGATTWKSLFLVYFRKNRLNIFCASGIVWYKFLRLFSSIIFIRHVVDCSLFLLLLQLHFPPHSIVYPVAVVEIFPCTSILLHDTEDFRNPIKKKKK